MLLRSLLHRVAMRFSSYARVGCALAVLAMLAAMWPAPAMAANSVLCGPYNITVASGSSYDLDANDCVSFGGVGNIVTPAQWGNVDRNVGTSHFVYSTNDTTHTSDFFSFLDSDGDLVQVNVTITGAASTITTQESTLPSPQRNVAYSQQLHGTGGTGPYQFSVSGGLPPGLTMSGTGLISGTPTTLGNYNITVTVTDSTAATGTAAFNLTVTQATITVTGTPPNGAVSTTYSYKFTATGGVSPYTFTKDTGTLPAGLTLASDGTLSGTPTTLGTSNFNIKAMDANGDFAAASFAVNILAVPPPVAGIQSATVAHGSSSNNINLPLTGGPATSVAVSTQATHGTATAVGTSITYTPVASYSGTDSFAYTATNASGTSSPATVSITVSNAAIVYAPTTVGGTVGVAYSQPMAGATGGTAPYTYTASGSLPPGLTLAANGTLSGTPTGGGTYTFTITAKDSSTGTGPFSTTSGSLTLNIGAPTITVTPTSLTLRAGNPVSQTIVASGGISPHTFSALGLPAGLTLDANGLLHGTPTATGSVNFTITATDKSTGTGPYTGSQAYPLTIGDPVLTLSPASGSLNATYGVAYSQTFTTAGGNTPYHFTQTGTLPNGVSFNASTGLLSGTPTQPGNFPITISVTDSTTGTVGQIAANYTLIVDVPAMNLPPTIPDTAKIGQPYTSTVAVTGGVPPYTYTVAGAPSGLTVSSTTGEISWTPTTTATSSFTLTVNDSNGGVVSKLYQLHPAPPTLINTSTFDQTTTGGEPYTATFSATGGTAPYEVTTASTLPTGLTLDPATGILSGTPKQSGNFNLIFKITDSSTGTGAPFSVNAVVQLIVNPPGISLPTTLPLPVIGQSYNHTFTATGGHGPYTYTMDAGTVLPTSMIFHGDGAISGTPTKAGQTQFTIKVTDDNGFTATQAYDWTLAPPQIAITATVPSADAMVPYSGSVTASGGTPGYSFSVGTGGLPPGISLSSSGQLSGAATAAGDFTFEVIATDTTTGPNAPYDGRQSVTIHIGAPAISITPTSLPNQKVGVPMSSQLTASGMAGSFTFTLSGAGGLPVGIGLSSAGVLSGTPTTPGSYNFTVKATGPGGFSGEQALTINVVDVTPVAVNDNAGVNANSAVTIPVTSNDTGPITSIAITSAPGHGTVTVNGLNAIYTPATNFFGTDTFHYTATGPGGTSNDATVTVAVAPLAVPTAAPQTITVLAGQSVVIHGAAGATGSPFTGLAISTAPTVGTVTVSGTDMTYTAAADAQGATGFDYTLSNPFGTSAPAHVTVTVNPLPITVPKTAAVAAGKQVTVDLTAGAHGGPFTAATLVSVTPSNAGTATVHASGSGYALDFTADIHYAGDAVVTYTLANAYATSAPGTVTVKVTGRSDPSKDAEVRGILDAQADAARRLAIGQISNFTRRLESLHNGVSSGFTNGITMASAGSRQNRDPMNGLREGDEFTRRYLVNDDEPGTSGAKSVGPGLPGDVAVWTGGAVNFGKSQVGASDNGIDFTTSGLSLGIDKQFGPNLALGAGVGYGHDASDIGRHNSRSTVDSYNVAIYGSYRPIASMYLDGLVGYQWLSFDARRYVTDNGNTVHGSRDGKQWFGSFAIGYEHRTDGSLVSPYARLDIAQAKLDSYTEQGDAIYALNYGRQTVKTSTGTLGVRAEWTAKRDYGVWIPRLRAEFGHDFQGSSTATMRYADLLTGPMYQATLANQSRNHTLLGAGIELQTLGGFILRAEYQNLLDNSSRDNQSILLGVEKKFP
ncbi:MULTISPECIES: putative Ig domain-containing protein [Dyella]|uniref:Autotransporter domain-containing protein n=2 Tax=Dyella TaxID=231454 RepID=A0A4R0YQ00_9GAMM|nr:MULTISPECIES: putative Ig domain-containing protein [Dyella]TBR35967.1 autotransporter domain-containing protein [Dyella terrae]TCI08486.1 autotransporter domain-containing protein [Dyella soli]